MSTAPKNIIITGVSHQDDGIDQVEGYVLNAGTDGANLPTTFATGSNFIEPSSGDWWFYDAVNGWDVLLNVKGS